MSHPGPSGNAFLEQRPLSEEPSPAGTGCTGVCAVWLLPLFGLTIEPRDEGKCVCYFLTLYAFLMCAISFFLFVLYSGGKIKPKGHQKKTHLLKLFLLVNLSLVRKTKWITSNDNMCAALIVCNPSPYLLINILVDMPPLEFPDHLCGMPLPVLRRTYVLLRAHTVKIFCSFSLIFALEMVCSIFSTSTGTD